jgi:hypothetical protein
MFKKIPKIYAHKAAMTSGNFVTPEVILNPGTDTVANLFHRYCPHRMYPMHTPGEVVQQVQCKFHGFEWTASGTPVNNNRKINCGTASVGRSGLVMKDFVEPEHKWVDDLAQETNLVYSHACTGESTGSWLWMMDVQADLLHVRAEGIHPGLGSEVTYDELDIVNGDDWILQTHPKGWWLFVYPYTFVEWMPGRVSVNYTVPKDPANEFGFSWITQFYYSNNVSAEEREQFETLDDVWHEDVTAIEKQKGPYFPLSYASHKLEEQCVHFGNWVRQNRIRTNEIESK